jgi:hypothetical protein
MSALNRRHALAALALTLAFATPALAQQKPGMFVPPAPVAALPAPAPACTPRIALSNGAQRTVQEVFVRPVGAASWGRDLLGERVIRPGQQAEIAPAASGLVDLMVMAADGTTRALWRVNVCAVRQVALTADLALRAE